MSTARLVIFDIDGTLTRTNEIDEHCYACAVREVLGIDGISTDWGAYRQSTDPGILCEIIETNCRRVPTLRDIRMVRSRFVQLIDEMSHSQREGWEAVEGAASILGELRERGWMVAIATGGWGASARRKLKRAGIEFDSGLIACADDAMERLDIIRRAARRATTVGDAAPVSSSIPTVYVGDGRWDLYAAREGGYGFVGIGHGERAMRLTEAGSPVVLSDFSDRSLFEQALSDALADCGAQRESARSR